MSKRAVGVDIGGTNISAAVVNAEGKLLSNPATRSTQASEKADVVINNISGTIEEAINKSRTSKTDLTGIGLGVPTTFDEKGLLLPSKNLPSLTGKDLVTILSDRFSGIEIKKGNDANCFVLGEAEYGSLASYDYSCGITLGTGLGVGLFLNGRLYQGSSGSAGEMFKSPYHKGDLESVLSGPGIRRRYRELTGKSLSAREVAVKARNDDDKAIETWKNFGRALGHALAYVANLLDIEAATIGGSLSKANDLFIDRTKAELEEHTTEFTEPELLKSKKVKCAGIIGAAALFF